MRTEEITKQSVPVNTHIDESETTHQNVDSYFCGVSLENRDLFLHNYFLKNFSGNDYILLM